MWQRISRLGTVAEFWRVFSELNPETIRTDAERHFRLLVLGQAGAGKTTLVKALAGPKFFNAADGICEIATGSPFSEADELPSANLHLYVIDASAGITLTDKQMLRELRRGGRSVAVAINKCDLVANRQELEYVSFRALGDVPPDRVAFGASTLTGDFDRCFGPLLLRALPEFRLALPRRLAGLRLTVGDEIIAETARVNAEFALLSNLPANIPIIGGIIGGSADFVVLTKNQALMIFKLAAIHGRDLRSKVTLAAELAPVVGAAFLWRTVARELIGMLPSVVGAVPKTAVGYAGTYVVGKMAQYYYNSEGARPTRAMIQRFTTEALQSWRSLLARRSQLHRALPAPEKWQLGETQSTDLD